LVGKICRTAAIIGERCDRGEHVLIAALAAEARLHPPDRDQRPRRHAVALLDRGEQRRVFLLSERPRATIAAEPRLTMNCSSESLKLRRLRSALMVAVA